MGISVGVLREEQESDDRAALLPEHVGALGKIGCTVTVEKDTGARAGASDAQYRDAGAAVGDFAKVMGSDIVLTITGHAGKRLSEGKGAFRKGQLVIGYMEPYSRQPIHTNIAGAGASAFAVELIPRITRAQSMDVLSAMANIAGYRAVLVAAERLAKLFPLMMTAAGTVVPSKVLVIGAGVAGLQGIATAKRLGAVVRGYDIRPQVKEQIESLGAEFVELPLDEQESESGEGTGGYAKEMSAEFYQRQQELLAAVVGDSDVVICTAAVPGKPSPRIVSKAMVQGMRAGSVIVDLAAGRGGNCEVTKRDAEIEFEGVSVFGPSDLAAQVGHTASHLYGRNMIAIITHLLGSKGSGGDDTGKPRLHLDSEDEITAASLIIENGAVRRKEIEK